MPSPAAAHCTEAIHAVGHTEVKAPPQDFCGGIVTGVTEMISRRKWTYGCLSTRGLIEGAFSALEGVRWCRETICSCRSSC